jgi:hypothetical protein
MKIDEILLADQLLDEGVWDAIKSGAGKVGRGLGAVGQAAGAIAGVPAGIAGSVKRGYNNSVQSITGGPRVDTNLPASQYSIGQQSSVSPQSSQTQGAPTGQVAARTSPMNFNQLTQAISGAQLTPNQKTQLTRQIAGGVANTPAQTSGSRGSTTLGASGAPQTPAQTRVAAQTTAATIAQNQMATNPAQVANPISTTTSVGTPATNSTNTAPITSPASVAAQAANPAPRGANGRQIPALVRPTGTNEGINFHSKFLGRML